ncbi:tetratricopeptide repeat protein [Nocardioides astragali]|uniref:Tetratricopeptide repeat protein n=1 Tax=Nocardioides astragali TaxID=1776736 RepID=A0ABW2N2N8_9ACTN|nr:tetratricopeptide repeat protein [Nocardioides astragali]
MDDHDRQIAHAEALLELGRGEQAERSVRGALATDPGSAHLVHLLARALLIQGRPAEAVHPAREAVRLDPHEVEHMILLAAVLLEARHAHDAYDVALRAVALSPDDWTTHLVVAGARLDMGGEDSRRVAELAAHRAVTLAPHEADAHNMYGITRWRADDVKTAERAFNNALAIDPQHAHAQRNLASLQLDRGELADGALTLSRALATSPQEDELHASLGRAAATVLLHTALVAALTTIILGTLYFWIPSSVFVPLAGGAAFAAVGPLVPPFRNLPRGSWRLMVPRRTTRHELPVLIFGWSVLGVCGVAWFPPSRVALILALSTLAALLALGVLLMMRSVGPNSPEES